MQNQRGHFNPRTPCGVRQKLKIYDYKGRKFQSTHPVRGATCRECYETRYGVFQSTHPVRGATQPMFITINMHVISIHAPRAGCDPITEEEIKATVDFNPRTPCGVRPEIRVHTQHLQAISIHAPRAGCDTKKSRYLLVIHGFQSTHPVRGATDLFVSIPAGSCHFNPRTPCGVRRFSGGKDSGILLFQSTHPVRGATAKWETGRGDPRWISIHAPRAGCDVSNLDTKKHTGDFNPRTPCGVRLGAPMTSTTGCSNFNPRTPCGVRQQILLKQYL